MTYRELMSQCAERSRNMLMRWKDLARMDAEQRRMAGYKDAEEILARMAKEYADHMKWLDKIEKLVPEEEWEAAARSKA